MAFVSVGVEGQVITVLAITAKVVSNVGWFIMWVQCVELFPTTIRVTGSNFCALAANICTTPAPYVILMVNWKTNFYHYQQSLKILFVRLLGNLRVLCYKRFPNMKLCIQSSLGQI